MYTYMGKYNMFQTTNQIIIYKDRFKWLSRHTSTYPAFVDSGRGGPGSLVE